MRAVKRGLAADGEDHATRRNVASLASRMATADPADRLAQVVVKGCEELMAPAGSLTAHVESMLESAVTPNDAACAVEACAFAFGADADAAEIAARAARVVEHVSLDGVSAKQCVSALARVRAIDKGAGEALRAKCASAIPRGEAFNA